MDMMDDGANVHVLALITSQCSTPNPKGAAAAATL